MKHEREFKRESREILVPVMPLIVSGLLSVIPTVLVYFSEGEIPIPFYIFISFPALLFISCFFYFIFRIVHLILTLAALKAEWETEGEFLSKTLRQPFITAGMGKKLYKIKFSYRNAANEPRFFSTRPLFTAAEAEELEQKKQFKAKRLGSYLVITEPLNAPEPIEPYRYTGAGNPSDYFLRKKQEQTNLALVKSEMNQAVTALEKWDILCGYKNKISYLEYINCKDELADRLEPEVRALVERQTGMYEKLKAVFDCGVYSEFEFQIELNAETRDLSAAGSEAETCQKLKYDLERTESFAACYALFEYFQLELSKAAHDEILGYLLERFKALEPDEKPEEYGYAGYEEDLDEEARLYRECQNFLNILNQFKSMEKAERAALLERLKNQPRGDVQLDSSMKFYLGVRDGELEYPEDEDGADA